MVKVKDEISTTKMEEISISLEETNRLRAQLGLPAIPTPKSQPTASKPSKSELSIEETNKVRISLGLKPIELVTPKPESKPKLESTGKADNDIILKKKLEETRQKLQMNKKLQRTKTILDNYEDQSTDEWLSNIGHAKATINSKSPIKKAESDTKQPSLQLSHSIDELKDIEDNEVFTLNDKNILNDSDDELSNFSLARKAKIAQDMEEKQKVTEIKNGIGYKPLNDDTYDIKDNVIIQNGSIDISTGASKTEAPEKISTLKRKVDVTLFDEEEDLLFNRKPKEKTSMKKLKKKKAKDKDSKSRIKLLDDDGVDMVIKPVKLTPIDNEIEDDLESTLSLQRQLRQQKRQHLKPEEIAKEIRGYAINNEENEMEKDIMKGIETGNDFVFDPTNDFLNSIEVNDNIHKVEPVETVDLEPLKSDTQHKNESDKATIEDHVDVKVSDSNNNEEEETTDQDLNKLRLGGVGKTLKYLKEKNLIKPNINTNHEQREKSKQLELTKIKISIEERKLKDTLEKDPSYKKLDPKQQEEVFQTQLDNILLQKDIIKPTTDLTTERYTPKIDIKYKNSLGQELNTKEAYKYLSGKFHGTSKEDRGKMKKLKKIKKPSSSLK